MVILDPLIEKLKPLSHKIILYGSSSKGENLKTSDLDLCLFSNNRKQVGDILLKSPLREQLQAVIVSQNDFVKLKKKNPVFYKEVMKGIYRLKNKKYKYATITAYYSMFHIARALIYSKGYREKSHYYLLVALQSLFVDNGLLEENLVNAFHDAMVLREDADYHAEFSKEGAESTIESAKQFIQKAKSILK
ncbi:MAG: HEPN domain-containing protein [bacterium]